MRAAARHALRPQRRGTRVPPYGFFADFVGVGVPDDPFAPHPQKCHCEPVTDVTGVANRTPPTHRTSLPCLRRAGCPHPVLSDFLIAFL